jgi:acyltransferase
VSLAFLAVFVPDAYRSSLHLARLLVLTPAWHLWYVPALFGALLATRLLAGTCYGRWFLLAVAVVGVLVFETPLHAHLGPLSVWLDQRYLGYFVWFLLGLGVRNGWWRVPPAWVRALAIVAGAAGWFAGFYGHPWLGAVGFQVLNVGATMCVPAALQALRRPVPVIGAALTRVGKHSLWLYLLHPFITEWLRRASFPLVTERLVGLAVTVLLVAGFAAGVWMVERARGGADLVKA